MIVSALTLYNLLLPLMICGGLAFIVLVGGAVIYALDREDHGRPLLPWGPRMRVERAKANLELDAIEVKRIAVEHQRTLALNAVRENDTKAIAEIALGASPDESRYKLPYK